MLAMLKYIEGSAQQQALAAMATSQAAKAFRGPEKGCFQKSGFGRSSLYCNFLQKSPFPAALPWQKKAMVLILLDPKTGTMAYSSKLPFYKTALLFALEELPGTELFENRVSGISNFNSLFEFTDPPPHICKTTRYWRGIWR